MHERLNIQFHEKLKKDRTRHRWRIPTRHPLRHWPCLHFSQQNSIAMKVNTLYLDLGVDILIFISQKSVFFLPQENQKKILLEKTKENQFLNENRI